MTKPDISEEIKHTDTLQVAERLLKYYFKTNKVVKKEVKKEIKKHKKSKYKNIGTYKITEYCSVCNTPTNTTKTASGRYVPYYSVACSDLPLGTIIYIDKKEYRVDDTGCKSGIIDMLVEPKDGACACDLCEYKDVYIKNNKRSVSN